MIELDTRSIVPRLKAIESLAVIPRVASTNLVARRIVNECIENELSLPQAMIIAGEQFAGRGRNERQWSSPPGKGIYATTLLTRPARELALVPLAMANIVATFLRDVYAIDARIKWPNDILVDARKIAGILIEARVQDERVYLLIGTGVNVEPVKDDARPNAVAISEVTRRDHTAITDATLAFIEHVDAQLARPFEQEAVLRQWRALAVHKPGDRIHCVLADRTVTGTWSSIDDHGRAVLNTSSGEIRVSAGDLMLG
ncbi:MAG TPA: biotin--[acetyl-CoA-carboxylase] ligase [Thermoanaerobaculia bacterium]|jgi:BirA family biotin operon repressor/biotin-[acetyl-CoA-carboxylase] ligase